MNKVLAGMGMFFGSWIFVAIGGAIFGSFAGASLLLVLVLALTKNIWIKVFK